MFYILFVSVVPRFYYATFSFFIVSATTSGGRLALRGPRTHAWREIYVAVSRDKQKLTPKEREEEEENGLDWR